MLKDNQYKPCFSGHDTFPLRYGWLQKAYQAVIESGSAKEAVHVFRDPGSIARFGVGRNMVGAIRYWATGAGVLRETDAGLEATWLGDMLFGENSFDPYLEEEASLWLLHWYLAARPKLTSAYWLFNEYRGGSFVRQDITMSLLKLARECEWPRVSETSVDRDLQCLLRAYIGGRGANDVGDSILAELGLIRPIDKQRVRLSRGVKPNLPDAVFLYCLKEFWENNIPDKSTMSFENVTYSPGSPGKVFLLNEDDVSSRLERLESTSEGVLKWSETAGLRQIVRSGVFAMTKEQSILRNSLESTDHREAA